IFMLPPPPSSPLFPYTTLFRSIAFPMIRQWPFFWLTFVGTILGTALVSSLTYTLVEKPGIALGRKLAAVFAAKPRNDLSEQTARSEEHTSELQSPYDLVCRLLL